MWFALCNAFSPQPTHLKVLQSANHRDHPCTFGKSWGLNALQSANHRDHLCTFQKLGTKSKVLVKHRHHPSTLLYSCNLLDTYLRKRL
ncbi:hypothetical protein Hanom_Chr01g00087461 [Helianthus anomalus]